MISMTPLQSWALLILLFGAIGYACWAVNAHLRERADDRRAAREAYDAEVDEALRLVRQSPRRQPTLYALPTPPASRAELRTTTPLRALPMHPPTHRRSAAPAIYDQLADPPHTRTGHDNS